MMDLKDGITSWMAGIMAALAVVVFIALQFIPAPYGRHGSNSRFGINARLAWFIQEIPAFVVPILLWLQTDDRHLNITNSILLAAFLIHYFQRSFIYPYLMGNSRSVPLDTFIPGFFFCLYNGFMQSRYLLSTTYPINWMFQLHFISGIALFGVGMCINIHSDHILRSLRKPGESGYKIPRGGFFELVTGANYFGEMIEWSGFALASWSWPAFAFALFTVANIGPRAVQHHKWYLKQFEDYPKERAAIIPFIL